MMVGIAHTCMYKHYVGSLAKPLDYRFTSTPKISNRPIKVCRH